VILLSALPDAIFIGSATVREKTPPVHSFQMNAERLILALMPLNLIFHGRLIFQIERLT